LRAITDGKKNTHLFALVAHSAGSAWRNEMIGVDGLVSLQQSSGGLALEKSDFRSFDQDGIDNGRLDIQGPLSSGPQKTGRLFRGLNLELGFFPGIYPAVQRLH
jgi:hypothetical protein